MATGLRVAIFGIKDLIQDLEVLDKAINTEDILDSAGAFLLNQIRTRFLAQESPSGEMWPESGAAAKRKAQGKGGGTLFDTGTLFNSISLGKGGPGFRTIFTDVEYAEQHNFGKEGQVKREFLGFNIEDEKGVERIVEARIKLALGTF